MTGLPTFFERELADDYAKENFRKLREFLVSETPWLGFKFFEVEFTAAQTDFDFVHGLGFQVQDAILSFISNGATLTFVFDKFTKDSVRFSVTAACKVRMILGAFK